MSHSEDKKIQKYTTALSPPSEPRHLSHYYLSCGQAVENQVGKLMNAGTDRIMQAAILCVYIQTLMEILNEQGYEFKQTDREGVYALKDNMSGQLVHFRIPKDEHQGISGVPESAIKGRN